MHWSHHGLHQSLQLKHSAVKPNPVSMKAVFMSNIAYFTEYKPGKLHGLTGKLGSTTKCDMLRKVFNVDCFAMPRFKPRFCLEVCPLGQLSKRLTEKCLPGDQNSVRQKAIRFDRLREHRRRRCHLRSTYVGQIFSSLVV